MNYRLLFTAALFISILAGCKPRKSNESVSPVNPVTPPAGINQAVNIDVHEAALNGKSELVAAYLDGSGNPDIADSDGRTPLIYASFNGHTEIVRMLLKKGASVNFADPNGTTPLMMAASGPYPQAVTLLLEHNADPDIVDKKEHFTALMYAASEGQLEVVKLLILYKADLSKKDIDGDDAITFARNNGHTEVVRYLQGLK